MNILLMSLISFKFLKWRANTELTMQLESPGQEQDNREDGFYIASPETASVPPSWKPEWGKKTETGKAASPPTSPPSPPFMKCSLGTVLSFDVLPKYCPFCCHWTSSAPVTDRSCTSTDISIKQPSAFSIGTSLSHTENAPSHVCQMQGLKKEVTFILEV